MIQITQSSQHLFWLRWLLLLGLSLITVGCVAINPDLEQAQQHNEEIPPPTAFVETHVNADWTNVQSRTEDGLAMLGNPDAPVTFIDYSDFL